MSQMTFYADLTINDDELNIEFKGRLQLTSKGNIFKLNKISISLKTSEN